MFSYQNNNNNNNFYLASCFNYIKQGVDIKSHAYTYSKAS